MGLLEYTDHDSCHICPVSVVHSQVNHPGTSGTLAVLLKSYYPPPHKKPKQVNLDLHAHCVSTECPPHLEQNGQVFLFLITCLYIWIQLPLGIAQFRYLMVCQAVFSLNQVYVYK